MEIAGATVDLYGPAFPSESGGCNVEARLTYPDGRTVRLGTFWVLNYLPSSYELLCSHAKRSYIEKGYITNVW